MCDHKKEKESSKPRIMCFCVEPGSDLDVSQPRRKSSGRCHKAGSKQSSRFSGRHSSAPSSHAAPITVCKPSCPLVPNRQLIAEILDEEFECFLRIALSFVRRLGNPKDVQIAKKFIKQCEQLMCCPHLDSKMNVNEFFKFFLRALHWSANNPSQERSSACAHREEVSKWLKNNEAYMAVKNMPDDTTVVYFAVAHNPCFGWAEGGLEKLYEHALYREKHHCR